MEISSIKCLKLYYICKRYFANVQQRWQRTTSQPYSPEKQSKFCPINTTRLPQSRLSPQSKTGHRVKKMSSQTILNNPVLSCLRANQNHNASETLIWNRWSTRKWGQSGRCNESHLPKIPAKKSDICAFNNAIKKWAPYNWDMLRESHQHRKCQVKEQKLGDFWARNRRIRQDQTYESTKPFSIEPCSAKARQWRGLGYTKAKNQPVWRICRIAW